MSKGMYTKTFLKRATTINGYDMSGLAGSVNWHYLPICGRRPFPNWRDLETSGREDLTGRERLTSTAGRRR